MVSNIESGHRISEADEFIFERSSTSLKACERPHKLDLYRFLGLQKTDLTEKLLLEADSAVRSYERSNKTPEKLTAGLAVAIFRNKRDLYDFWLIRNSALSKILEKAGELTKISKSFEKYLDAIDLRIVIKTSAYPHIDPITAASHLESNGYRLDRTIDCDNSDCGSINNFYYYRCSACDAGLDSRNKKSTDDSVDKLYRSWLDTKAGLIEILAQAEIYAGPGKNLEVKPLRKIIREVSFPWGITAKDTVPYLKDLGYEVGMQIRCAQSGCNILNDFSQIICTNCNKDIGAGQDCVICPHGHESPNLTRYCQPSDGSECSSEIQYRKPVMPFRLANVQPIKKSIRGISKSILDTVDLVNQGLPLNEVAEDRGISETTLLSHLERFVSEGGRLHLEHLMPSDDKRDRIEMLFEEMGDARLSRVHAALGSGYTWEELAVVRLNDRQIQYEESAEQPRYTTLTLDDAQGIWSSVQIELNKHDNTGLKKIGGMLAGTTIDAVLVDPKRLIINFQDLFSQQAFFRFVADPVTNKLLELVIESHFDDKYEVQSA